MSRTHRNSPTDLLSRPLVVCIGEFGRSPRINSASDKIGAYVKDQPVRPQDLSATIYQTLGVPFESRITRDGVSRPLSTGTPLAGVLA